jgi:hypothetical protein
MIDRNSPKDYATILYKQYRFDAGRASLLKSILAWVFQKVQARALA